MNKELYKESFICAYKRGGLEEINRINKECNKLEFITMICIVPSLVFLISIGIFLINKYFMSASPFIQMIFGISPSIQMAFNASLSTFIGMLFVWFFLHHIEKIKYNNILSELKSEGRIK